MKLHVATVLILCLLIARSASTQDAKTAPAKKGEKAAEELHDKRVATQHAATIQGKEMKYTATAGTLVMRSEEGDAKAQMFFVAYTKDGRERDRAAPGHVRVQRRTRLGVGVAAFGNVGAKTCQGPRRRVGAGASLHAVRQSAFASGPDGPRIHRPREHGLQPTGQRRKCEPISRLRRRPAQRQSIHSRLRDQEQPLAVAEVSNR